jgi:hypothetical protein
MEMNGGVAFGQDGTDKDGDKFETCNKIAATYWYWVQKKGRY